MAKPKKHHLYKGVKIKDRSKKLDKRRNRMIEDGKGFGIMVRNAQLKRYRKSKGKTSKGGARR